MLKQPTKADLDLQRVMRDVAYASFRGDLTPDILLAYFIDDASLLDERDGSLYKVVPREVVTIPVNAPFSQSRLTQIRARNFTLSVDTVFSEIVDLCALPRQRQVIGGDPSRVWMGAEIKRALRFAACADYEAKTTPRKRAHSIEVWSDDALVGGMIVLAKGAEAYSLSVFSQQPYAGFAACAFLRHILRQGGAQRYIAGLPSNIAYDLGGVSESRESYLRSKPPDNANPLDFPVIPDRITLDAFLEIERDQDNGWTFPRKECDASKRQGGSETLEDIRETRPRNRRGGQAGLARPCA